MHIKFKAPDPRAGTVANMDSSRGQHFVDSGAAVLVKEDGAELGGAPAVKLPQAVKPSEGLTVQQLKDALAAKSVTIPEGTTLKADLADLLDKQAA